MEEESMESDEDVYEVEKIVDNVVVGGKTYYRVRWKNYSEDGDTWEPRENLLSCEDLLNNYIRTQSEKSSGLSLPGDVFTAGTAEESGSENTPEEQKKTKGSGRKTRQTAREKKATKPKPKKGQTKATKVSSSESSSEEEPQVKDPFWENLQQGKIDVFASDLYSKVKQRRFPEGETQEAPVKTTKKKPKKKEGKPAKRQEANETQQKESKMAEETTDKNVKQEKPKEMKKSVEISSDSDENDDDLLPIPVEEPEKNEVLEYLAKEIQSKKDKKSRKTKESKEKPKKPETRNEKSDSARKSFISSLFEESEAHLPSEEMETEDSAEKEAVKTKTVFDETIPKPKLVLEKIDLALTEKDEIRQPVKKQSEKNASKDDSKRRAEKEKHDDVQKDQNTSPDIEGSQRKSEEKKKSKRQDSSTRDSDEEIRKEEKKKDSSSQASDSRATDFSSTDEESKRSQSKSKPKDSTREKVSSLFEPADAFSAQLQEGDLAVSDMMLKKKEKTKKKNSSKHGADRISSSPVSLSANVTQSPTTSVLELLTQEMERTANLGGSDSDSKLTPFDAAVKDAHNKLGLKAPSTPISSTEKSPPPSCAPDMVEFLKIKVNFELDEISVKDIERHHEMGEPPCRLERDVTNAEFRQYIRANNFEMVHEALKSKKMMYNLEHTDSLWITQLMVAAAAGFDEIVKVLCHHGARVNARSKTGQTALMFAAEKGHDIVCRILIAYGAYINIQTTTGETALMKAAKSGYGMIVRYLLQAGADPTIKSHSLGTTAREMAERAAHPSISESIRLHETNINAYVNECIHRECHILGIKTVGLPILATRVYNLRETASVHVTFNCVMQSLPPNQGLLLFSLHGMIGSGLSIKCRMRGPCFVNAVTLNNYVMDPVMPGKQVSDEDNFFITNLVWKTGQNSLRLFLSQDPLSSEKLFISVFVCGFAD